MWKRGRNNSITILTWHYLALSILSMDRSPNKRYNIVFTRSQLCKSIHAVLFVITHDGIDKVSILITSTMGVITSKKLSTIDQSSRHLINICAGYRLWSEKIIIVPYLLWHRISIFRSHPKDHTHLIATLQQARVQLIYSQYVAGFCRKEQQTHGESSNDLYSIHFRNM